MVITLHFLSFLFTIIITIKNGSVKYDSRIYWKK